MIRLHAPLGRRSGQGRRPVRPGALLQVIVLLSGLSGVHPARAQDLEPKAYSPSPAGANFLILGYAWSKGQVLTDPTLPLSDVQASLRSPVLATGHTFGLFGKLAMFTAAVPYVWGEVSGKVYEEARAVTRSGAADARVKLSVNLRGNDAMTAAQFVKAPRRTIVGASLVVSAPTGQYDDTRLINLGTNRWAFKPEIGVSIPRGRWDLDAYVGAWLFTENPSFFPGGMRRTQDPVLAVQGHASYTVRSRLWVAFDATWYAGGKTRVNGGAPSVGLNNARYGGTVSFPIGRRQSFKVAYSSGLLVRSGSNFRTLALGWQWLWLSPRR